MISRQDSMNLAPANWFIISNDGTNITATNKVTGQTFSGTQAAFHTLLGQSVDPSLPTANLLTAHAVEHAAISEIAQAVIKRIVAATS